MLDMCIFRFGILLLCFCDALAKNAQIVRCAGVSDGSPMTAQHDTLQFTQHHAVQTLYGQPAEDAQSWPLDANVPLLMGVDSGVFCYQECCILPRFLHQSSAMRYFFCRPAWDA